MAIDYKKELESAAKSMILVHEPDLLIRMILRLVVQKLHVTHAGILLSHRDENNKETYVLTVSRGSVGTKVPAGFARMDTDNALVKLFRDNKDRIVFSERLALYEEIKKTLNKNELPQDLRQLLEKVLYQMDIFDIVACIPSFYRDDLLGILLLGKKQDDTEYDRDELNFFVALASDVAMALRNARLFKQLQEALSKRQQLFINTTVALAAAIEAKDYYTHGHTERVTYLSLEIAKVMKNDESLAIDGQFLEDLHVAALLHDIGKIGIPESILNKEAPLTEFEWTRMKTHPLIGATILQPIAELDRVIAGVKHHHERYDGKGYPSGLDNGSIPMIAAIIAVADSFDAMTTDRPYRKAKSKEDAVEEIRSLAGQQFHPQVVSAFLELSKDKKI